MGDGGTKADIGLGAEAAERQTAATKVVARPIVMSLECRFFSKLLVCAIVILVVQCKG